jgi:PAS domain S-box-containing protein
VIARLVFWLRPRFADPHAVLLRQLCIAGTFGLSLFLLLVPGMGAGSPALVLLSAALVLAATVAALLQPVHHRRRWVLLAIPFTDLLAVGVLRGTTGGSASVYGALLVLTVLSLAIEPGRLPLLLTAIGCVLVIGAPLALSHQDMPAAAWVRVVFTPATLVLTALTIGVLTNRLRSRIRAVQRLSRSQERLLQTERELAAATEAQAALLRESVEQLAGVISAITEQFIIATDASGRIEVFNPGAEQMLGLRADRVLGSDLVQALSPVVEFDSPGVRGAPEFRQLVARALEGRTDVGEWRFARVGRPAGTVQVSVTPRRDATNEIIGFLAVGTDVSHAREEARQKDEFVNLISHELRTPLSSILGYLELISDDDDNPLSADQRQYLATVERNAHRLLRLVGDLLFTAQVEAGKFNLDRQPVDLRQVTAAAVESARPAAAARQVQLVLTTADDPVVVDGDPVRLGQACDNLLSNAVKFTPPGGQVRVGVLAGHGDDGSGRALLAVHDTGFGIPAGELDRLFSRFFRASTATVNAVPGVGLGLTITRAIAQAHGGGISVSSTEGAGTSFTIDLPLAG